MKNKKHVKNDELNNDPVIDAPMLDVSGLDELKDALKSSGINIDDPNLFKDMEAMISQKGDVQELIKEEGIKLKTKVSEQDHKIITILYKYYKTLLFRYGIDYKGLRYLLDEFIIIAPSIDGKRAEQYVEGLNASALAAAYQNRMSAGMGTNTPQDMKGI